MGQEPVTLHDGDMLTVPELFPGWQVLIDELWSPEFD
jgi:Uma2 family endonuclease